MANMSSFASEKPTRRMWTSEPQLDGPLANFAIPGSGTSSFYDGQAVGRVGGVLVNCDDTAACEFVGFETDVIASPYVVNSTDTLETKRPHSPTLGLCRPDRRRCRRRRREEGLLALQQPGAVQSWHLRQLRRHGTGRPGQHACSRSIPLAGRRVRGVCERRAIQHDGGWHRHAGGWTADRRQPGLLEHHGGDLHLHHAHGGATVRRLARAQIGKSYYLRITNAGGGHHHAGGGYGRHPERHDDDCHEYLPRFCRQVCLGDGGHDHERRYGNDQLNGKPEREKTGG